MGLSLISEPDVPTHRRGNVLDLIFVSEQLARIGASTKTCTHLDVTSDHTPLITFLPGECHQSKEMGRLRPETTEETKFLRLLEENLAGIQPLPPKPHTRIIDETAKALTTAITEAYQASAQRTLGSGIGQP